jgi:hypothetical protein
MQVARIMARLPASPSSRLVDEIPRRQKLLGCAVNCVPHPFS